MTPARIEAEIRRLIPSAEQVKITEVTYEVGNCRVPVTFAMQVRFADESWLTADGVRFTKLYDKVGR